MYYRLVLLLEFARITLIKFGLVSIQRDVSPIDECVLYLICTHVQSISLRYK